jgi:hypothetical protein
LPSLAAVTDVFKGCANLLTLSDVNVASVTTIDSWFDDISHLETIDGLRLDSVSTTLNSLFNGHGALTMVKGVYAPKVSAWYRTFMNCKTLQSATNITVMEATSLSEMFKGSNALILAEIKGSEKVTNFSGMFNSCANLESVRVDVTSRAENISGMYTNCTLLKSVPMMVTSNVTNMSSTFLNCSSLTSMPTLDTSLVTNFYRTWRGCTGLSSFPVIDMSSVTIASETFIEMTLPAGVWDAILVHLEANIQAPTGLAILDGGSSVLSTAAGMAAKVNLNTAGEWTVLDGTP